MRESFVVNVLKERERAGDPVGTSRLRIPVDFLEILFGRVQVNEFLLHAETPLPELLELLSWIAYVAGVDDEGHQALEKEKSFVRIIRSFNCAQDAVFTYLLLLVSEGLGAFSLGALAFPRFLQLLDQSFHFLLDVEVEAHVRREDYLLYRFSDLLHLIKTQAAQHVGLIN